MFRYPYPVLCPGPTLDSVMAIFASVRVLSWFEVFETLPMVQGEMPHHLAEIDITFMAVRYKNILGLDSTYHRSPLVIGEYHFLKVQFD